MALFRFGSRTNQSKGVASINLPIPDFGGDYFADTSLHPASPPSVHGGWAAIFCVTATVLNAATKTNVNGLAGVTLPAGTWVYGIFSQIQLTSGSIIAYKSTD